MTTVSAPPIADPLELDVMCRALQRAHGFALYFARANTPVLQKQLHDWLAENLTRPLILVHLQPGEPIVEQLQAAEAGIPENAVLSVMGMDQMPKAEDEDWLPRQLNWRREAFHRLSHPLLIWLPEYLLVKLMKTAPDFFDWHSGFFEFEMTGEFRLQIIGEALGNKDRPMLARTERERRERIAVLKGLLDDYEKVEIGKTIILDVLNTLGMLYVEAGEYRNALQIWDRGLGIAQDSDKQAQGVFLGNLGIIYATLGETRRCIDYFERSLKLAKETEDKRNEAAWLGNLGLAYVDLGDLRQAIKYYEQALNISHVVGDKRGEVSHLSNIGLAFRNLGDTQRAIEYSRSALKLAQEIKDRRGEGVTLGNLGNAFQTLGDNKLAIEYYEKALSIAKEIGDRHNEGTWLGNLGARYAALGDTRQAISYFNSALEIARNIGDRHGEGRHMFNLGLSYKNLREMEKAKKFAQQALIIFEQIESPYAEQARRNLAEWEKDA